MHQPKPTPDPQELKTVINLSVLNGYISPKALKDLSDFLIEHPEGEAKATDLVKYLCEKAQDLYCLKKVGPFHYKLASVVPAQATKKLGVNISRTQRLVIMPEKFNEILFSPQEDRISILGQVGIMPAQPKEKEVIIQARNSKQVEGFFTDLVRAVDQALAQ